MGVSSFPIGFFLSSTTLKRALAFLGNFFEHFDTALFGLMLPFFAENYFPGSLPLHSLIKGFLLLPLSLISKPLGSVFFSYLAAKKGQEFSLKMSYIGMSLLCLLVTTCPLKINPTLAWAFFALIRLFQGFFSSGETLTGALFVVDQSTTKHKGFFSALFDASSVAGFLMASLGIVLLQKLNVFTTHWRLLFFVGAISFIPSLFLKKPVHTLTLVEQPGFFEKSKFLQVFLTCGISYAFFALVFTFSNAALPFICSLDGAKLQEQTTILLVLDMIVLPLFGFLSYKISSDKLMKLSLIFSVIFVPISFLHIQNCSLTQLFLIRLVWMICGACFSANLFSYYARLFPFSHQRLFLSLATSLGSSLIGHLFSSSALSMYNFFHSSFSIGCLFSTLCIFGLLSLSSSEQKKFLFGLKKNLG